MRAVMVSAGVIGIGEAFAFTLGDRGVVLSNVRIGLGCMRLSIDRRDDDERAVAMIREAVERGVSIFDTAHAYRREGTEPGHNERLIDRGASRNMDNATGINNTYIFVDYYWMMLNGLGQSNALRVGANTWAMGLAFEF